MRYNILEHAGMAEMKTKHPDWVWNRSDTHVVLGVPGSLDALKTPVEPGNSFSPGPGSYGVSPWVYVDGILHAPEEKPIEELDWSFAEGHLPVLCSTWHAGDIEVSTRIFTDGELENNCIKDYFRVCLANHTDQAKTFKFYLAIRSFGAAGGPITSLRYDADKVYINDAPLLLAVKPASQFGAVSYEAEQTDISSYARKGILPGTSSVSDSSSWASGALEYQVSLEPRQDICLDFVCHLHANHWMLNWQAPLENNMDIDAIETNFLASWRERLSIKLDLPDKRFTDAFQSQLVHLSMFTVHDSPRISPISYPLWWLRDGAYLVNALEKGGFHNFCEQACRGIAGKRAFGGFGSEGDAPGDIIWMMSEHYLLTKDKSFLMDMYPTIRESADLLIEMRHTDKPVKILTEFCVPYLSLEPNMDMLCIPAKDGLIMGRMDLHFPIIWVNSFAYLGLTRAAMCARELGLDDTKYREEAAALKDAILKKSQEIFGENDRDVNCAFWPTAWASKDDEFIAGKFDEFWNTVRYPNGEYAPEPLWTYFEAGQAHNNILRGQRGRAWVSIESFLANHTAPGLYTYHEGSMDENSFLLWQRTRGWDDINFITPHGWTAAELFLLLRDCLVYEENGAVIIGSGIPESWLESDFSVGNIPTFCGNLSFKYTAADKTLRVQTEDGVDVRHELPGVGITLKLG